MKHKSRNIEKYVCEVGGEAAPLCQLKRNGLPLFWGVWCAFSKEETAAIWSIPCILKAFSFCFAGLKRTTDVHQLFIIKNHLWDHTILFCTFVSLASIFIFHFDSFVVGGLWLDCWCYWKSLSVCLAICMPKVLLFMVYSQLLRTHFMDHRGRGVRSPSHFLVPYSLYNSQMPHFIWLFSLGIWILNLVFFF